MDFEFSEEELAFQAEVEAFLDATQDPAVMDPARENMAQIVDTPERRAFMAQLSEKGWLGITWPTELGGKAGSGVYEYLLNEALARRGAPQIGKGVGIIGKTLIRHGSDKLKSEFLPKILAAEVEFAVGYSEPDAGSDAAAMKLKAEKVDDGWILNGTKIWTTSAHFADWYWVGARTDPDAPKHHGITLFLVPMDHPGLTVNAIWTMGDERTNEVHFDNVHVPDDYVVGELNHGFQYISEALDLERFTMFTFSPIQARLDLLTEYVKAAKRDGRPLKDDPVVRSRIARLTAEAEVARVLGLRFVAAATHVEGKPPTTQASQYKLYATELSKRLADASMDLAGPESLLAVGTDTAPMRGRAESTYRYTVLDTIGGGTSEVQKNIIARRKLGLPKNF
ncbi:MAG: acyl-CoA dehydrogenase family protein [Acidimicrobiia bacterium]|nr:acyl-CoA dehydrogenase family protein [Acidimicrobiia bacterium]